MIEINKLGIKALDNVKLMYTYDGFNDKAMIRLQKDNLILALTLTSEQATAIEEFMNKVSRYMLKD